MYSSIARTQDDVQHPPRCLSFSAAMSKRQWGAPLAARATPRATRSSTTTPPWCATCARGGRCGATTASKLQHTYECGQRQGEGGGAEWHAQVYKKRGEARVHALARVRASGASVAALALEREALQAAECERAVRFRAPLSLAEMKVRAPPTPAPPLCAHPCPLKPNAAAAAGPGTRERRSHPCAVLLRASRWSRRAGSWPAARDRGSRRRAPAPSLPQALHRGRATAGGAGQHTQRAAHWPACQQCPGCLRSSSAFRFAPSCRPTRCSAVGALIARALALGYVCEKPATYTDAPRDAVYERKWCRRGKLLGDADGKRAACCAAIIYYS